MMRRALAAVLSLGLAGCAASPHSRAGGGVGLLRVQPVDWNPGRADIAGVRAVADAGGDVVAFSDGAATVLSGGRVVAVDRSVVRWVAAGTIPAADGSGPWIVGVDGDGRVRRLFGKATMEPVSDRFGLAAEHVVGVAALGGTVAGFQLQDEIAVADGAAVTRYGTGPISSFAGGGGRAGLGGDLLRTFEVATRRVSSFEIPGAPVRPRPGALVAVTASGKLFAATADTLWGEDEHGDLRVRFDAPGETIHGLAASGERVWFTEGAELGVVEGDRVLETRRARVSPAAQLVGSPSGDVWTITDGTLARYAFAGDGPAGWEEAVAPVFHRACEGCHRPGGEAGVVLATREAWEKRRAQIRRRVLEARDMPPPGKLLSEADRAAIRAWIER